MTKLPEDEKLIGGLHHVTNDIERLGDYAVLLAKETKYMKKNEVAFVDQTREELSRIYALISEMFELGFDAFKIAEPVFEINCKYSKGNQETDKIHA